MSLLYGTAMACRAVAMIWRALLATDFELSGSCVKLSAS